MKCGHCKSDHDTVSQVKLCFKRSGGTTVTEPPPALWGSGLRKVKPSEVRREESQRDLLSEINKIGREIPTGHYALPNTQTGLNDVAFYFVERADVGKWAGKTFVKQQLSSELQRLPRARTLQVLTNIAADPRAASERYGRLIGRCGICHRPLTNQESRERGIGPKCAMGAGWSAA